MVAPDGRAVEIGDVKDGGYIVDRSLMDRNLLQDAANAGARLFMSTPVTGIVRSTDGKYHCLSGAAEFIAPCVILAEGVESRLARDCGWEKALDLKDIETCAFGRLSNLDIPEDTCVFYLGQDVAPGGYLWIFPRGQGSANIGLGLAGSKSSAGKARELLVRFVNKQFPGSELQNIHCGGVPVGQWRRPLTRGGVMLAGDTALQVNCVNGGGIAYALLAGKWAGSVAAEAFANGTFTLGHLKKYEKLWARFHGKQQQRSYILKEMMLEYDDNILNAIASALLKEKRVKRSYLRVFLRAFSRHPFLMLKAFRLFR
jgi:digeranylgeranylglycerophospholipid reductase